MSDRYTTPEGYEVCESRIDASINFVRKMPDGGKIEARYVHRDGGAYIVYISSMTGCPMACRFCHLTQSGATMDTMLSVDDMVEQAEVVLRYGETRPSMFLKGNPIHFNFMARGEPLLNSSVGPELFERLGELARRYGMKPKIKISTIMPEANFKKDWKTWKVDGVDIAIYYSVYSVDRNWRKRWIPKGADVLRAMHSLAAFQKQTGQRVILHGALIEGENDDENNAVQIMEMARKVGVKADFNLVRYNPANMKSSEAEPEVRHRYVERVKSLIDQDNRVKQVERVGFDVAASCGMFMTA